MTQENSTSTRSEAMARLTSDLGQTLQSTAGTALFAKFADLQRDPSPNAEFLVVDAFANYIRDVILGSTIVPLPRHVRETVNFSNRIVSFILDDQIHFATGILVGPAHVLTTAHLFFEEDGRLIDPTRAERITIETHTAYLGEILMEGRGRTTTKLYRPDTNDEWLIDPRINGGKASRDVRALDFVILRLKDEIGEDPIGDGRRGWVRIPTTSEAEVLSPDLAIRVLQLLDREELLVSSGYLREVSANGFRILHTASTADSASGAAIVDDELHLLAMHVGGSASGERPKSNRGLPIRRVAEVIDAVGADGKTIRSKLV